MVRLNKYLADCGVASRRKCDALIQQGKVSVNHVVQQRLGIRIDPQRDQVEVDGKPVKRNDRHAYVLLNKPAGYVTTRSDEHGRTTVMDLVKTTRPLFPVGRLDKDTRGLLLLTSDGELAYRLMHPKFHVAKEYEVTLDRELCDADRRHLERGVRLSEGETAPCRTEWVDRKDRHTVRLTLHQGWKRQIRRMFANLGYQVVNLQRVAIASLAIGDLEEGNWRSLTAQEIQQLQEAVGGGVGN